MKKLVLNRENERKEMADLVEQDKLLEIKGKRPSRLPEVYIRPAMEGKRVPGDLELHSNGIRYKNQLKPDQKVDILFSNVKHCVFQPCENEMLVLIHFHLHNPIMIGKKKTKDVQFYREALDSVVDDTVGRRRKANYGDEDELAQEQEERRRRKQVNDEFKLFGEQIVEMSKTIAVDVPFRDLGFYGVPSRQNVLLQPTTECLVHLTEPPFFIVTLAEIEIAYLERVVFGLKNFDLVFVFKDHKKPPMHVNSIPMNSLEYVKDWLDSVDVVYAESNINFNWTNIMKTIQEDPVGFYEMGGWAALQVDNKEAAFSSDEEEGESEFEPSDESGDSSASDSEDDEDYDSEDASEEDEDYDEEDDEDEDAPDWDELEEESRLEDERREKKRLGTVSSQPSKKRK